MAFDEKQVVKTAQEMRCDIVQMITAAGSGHPGGSLSATDIVATLFFGDVLRYKADDPKWSARDRFILSKGHAAPVLYAALAHAGYFPRTELLTLRKFGSRLQGHPDSLKLPGVEVSTGSLGQGLSIAAGLAYGLLYGLGCGLACGQSAGSQSSDAEGGMPRHDEATPRVYALLGDGELQEGQIWEAAMFASHNRLGNLIAIVDSNKLQIDGPLSDVLNPSPIDEKFRAFNWRVISDVDGHDVSALKQALDEARTLPADAPLSPVVIIAHTIKGKGVSFMEGKFGWHGKAPSAEQCAAALEELAHLGTKAGA